MNHLRKLGLIGGIGHVTTLDYYRQINEEVNRRTGGDHFPELVLHSLDAREVNELWRRSAWDEFLTVVSRVGTKLRTYGAEGLLLCANTAHVVADDLQDSVGIPVINIVDATVNAITHQGMTSVGLLGTHYTMEMDFFTGRLRRAGIEPMVPDDEDRNFLHETIFSELARGHLSPVTRARYLDIIDSFGRKGAQAAILGCTDIQLLVRPDDSPMPLFDTMALHVAAAADFALGGTPRSHPASQRPTLYADRLSTP